MSQPGDTDSAPAGEEPIAPGLFDGITVIEFGQYVAAPIAAEFFAHGGAEVIKVEPVDGDVTRGVDPIPFSDGGGTHGRQFVIKARGKKSLPVDLSRPEGRMIARDLVAHADVVISNMRPGAMERLGLAYEHLRIDHPRLIMGEITGFGTHGPNAHRASVDPIAQAESGLRLALAPIGDHGAERQRLNAVGFPPAEPFIADYVAGLVLAFGIAGALWRREQSGRGERVTTSLMQAALFVQHRGASYFESVDQWKHQLVSDRAAGADLGDLQHQRWSILAPDTFFFSPYATRDGAITLGAAGQLGARLCAEFDIDDPRLSPEWAEVSRRGALLADAHQRVATAIGALGTAEVIDRLAAIGIPVGEFRFLEEVVLDPDSAEAGWVYRHDDPRLGPYVMTGPPLQTTEHRYEASREFPLFGVDTPAIMARLGYSTDHVAQLIADGVIAVHDSPPSGQARPHRG